MNKFSDIEAFLALVRAGLWEKEVRLSPSDIIDFDEVFRLAEEQAVVGLVAAGLEHVRDYHVPQKALLTFAGSALQIEQRNVAMNAFIGSLANKLKDERIEFVLLKGQGIAQCYKRPLWRTAGDVDLLLDEANYEKAKTLLVPLADKVDTESGKHKGLTIGQWTVELHGNQHCGLSPKMDNVIDEVQQEVCNQDKVRVWENGSTSISLPAPSEDVVFIFTHFLKHFYKGGLGLRQICDWCRLLWTYRESLDHGLLKSRIRKMGLMTEWKAFSAFAVEYLGMSKEAMPLYSPETKWKRKADKICSFIMEVGNMGHNRDNSRFRKPYLVRKIFSFGRRCGDLLRHCKIFPLDSLRFFPSIVLNGLRSVTRGEG